jgi:stearoyl-CoA desaturase (delta-9 desaturase)
MLKSLMRWIDSWSTPTTPKTLTAENSKIQWLRILPFILLHLACLAVFWVGVSWFALGFMLLFYLIRMFSITAFFHRIRLFNMDSSYFQAIVFILFDECNQSDMNFM